MDIRGQPSAHALNRQLYPSATDVASPSYMRFNGGGKSLVRDAAVTIKTMLVATDFSQKAAHTVERAVMLADDSGISKATLLHVVPRSTVGAVQRLVPVVGGTDEQLKRAQPQLRGLADEIRRRTRLLVEESVEFGNVVKTLQRFASDSDLTIVGAPGGHPLRDFAIGSTVERLLRQTRQSVLVVRRSAAESYRRVLVAVDLSTDAANAIAYTQRVAPQAQINLIHVYRSLYEGKMHYVADELIAESRMKARAKAASAMLELVLSHLPSHNVRLLLAHGYPVPRLLEKERELGADLVVVTKREQSFATEVLLESVTSQLIARSNCDVLIVR